MYRAFLFFTGSTLTSLVRFLGDALEWLVVLFYVSKLTGSQISFYKLSVLFVQIQLRAILYRSLPKIFTRVLSHDIPPCPLL